MDTGKTSPNTPWRRTADRSCPVPADKQAWIERSIHDLMQEFGAQPLLAGTHLLDDIAWPSSPPSDGEITSVVTRIGDLMGVDRDGLTIDIHTFSAAEAATENKDTSAVGHFRVVDGRSVIALDRREAGDPAVLIAIAAHEMGHARLNGEGRLDRRSDHERLTDLLTVYFGLGVYTANAAMHYSRAGRWSITPLGDFDEHTLNAASRAGGHMLGYLSEREFGYALACCCWLRAETDPAWSSRLDPTPRGYLQQGLRYLLGTGMAGEALPTRRRIGATVKRGATKVTVAESPGAHGPSDITAPRWPAG